MTDCPDIRFYRADERPHGVFSNLLKRPMRYQGREFPTAEHAYQYQKPRKQEVRDWLMAAPSPALLAMAAHGLYSWDIVPGWSKSKVAHMRCVLWAKFGQHADLRAVLMATERATLIETATVDNDVNRFWGEVPIQGKPGQYKGRNWLGQLLMGIREDFRCGIVSPEMIEGLANGTEPPE